MKYKKILITIGALSAFTMPLTFVLSCGAKTSENTKEVNDESNNGQRDEDKDPYSWVKESPRIIDSRLLEWEDNIKVTFKEIIVGASIKGYIAMIQSHEVLIIEASIKGITDTYLIPTEIDPIRNKLIVFKNGNLLPEEDPASKFVSDIHP